jgi:TM2 domain-containing membrane protein YozV
MTRASTSSIPGNPGVVALAAWLAPGAGYLLLGQRARGITIGLTIWILFFLGLLVGGVRALEVPGYDGHGKQLVASYYVEPNRSPVPYVGEDVPAKYTKEGWVLARHPLEEVRTKPWSIAQIMVGPIDILCDWWSLQWSRPSDPNDSHSEPIAARSHSRLNELRWPAC